MSSFVPRGIFSGTGSGTGATAATNATVGATSGKIALTSPAVFIVCYTQPIQIAFGAIDYAADTTIGFYLPVGFANWMQVPAKATHLHHIRASGTDGGISVLPGEISG